MKKVEGFRKIGHLKHVMRRWRTLTLSRRSVSGTGFPPPPGSLAVYVGTDRQRFVIPTRFLNVPAFSGLLRLAEEEYGFPGRDAGGLALPCDPAFFGFVLDALDRDESRYGNLTLDAFLSLFADLGPSAAANGSPCRYYASCNSSSRFLTRPNA